MASGAWKPLNADNSPDVDGLVAGLNEAGNKIFIGRATIKKQLAPGRLITTESPEVKAGLTLEYGNAEHFITEGIEYCAIAPNCKYGWEPSSKGKLVENAVEWFSDAVINANIATMPMVGSKMYVGRITAPNEVHVGKVHPPTLGFHYAHQGKVFVDEPKYEVLTCIRIPIITGATAATADPCSSTQIDELEEEIRNLKDANIAQQAAQEKELEEKNQELLEKQLKITSLQEKLRHCATCQCYN